MHDIVSASLIVGSTTLAKNLVETYLIPKLSSVGREIKIDKSIIEYIDNGYNKYLYMNTIVFKNQQKTINDLYIPLTVVKNDTKHNKRVEIKIENFPDKFIPEYKKVLLVDNAGMGKSTIIKYLYINTFKEIKGIPILIELRRLEKGQSIIEFMLNEMNNIEKILLEKDIIDLLVCGDFIFFFDGYDEIAEDLVSDVTYELKDFIAKVDKNMFIISSRDENSLTCFGDFQRFDIKPLTKEEAYNLIRKYDSDGELSKQLIDKLENEQNLKIIEEFLENPLMVSLLYKAFEYKSSVPYKKNIFYRQVFDALFEDHDKSKGGAYVHPKRSNLDVDDFHRVLRIFGFISIKEGVSYSDEKLSGLLRKTKQLSTGISFKERDFIHDITHAVPLLVKEGVEYKWIHKSFQEYFAANYICIDAKEKGNQYLSQMITSIKKYYNVLDFCYDIDYKQFRRVVIYPVIIKFINHYDNSYKSKIFENYSKKDIEMMKNHSFLYKEVYLKIFNENEIRDLARIAVDEDDPFAIFSEAFKDWNLFNESLDPVSVSLDESSYCIGKCDNKYYKSLLKLLLYKHSPIIKTINSYSKIAHEKNMLKKLKQKEYFLDDSINNLLNSDSDIFHSVNMIVNRLDTTGSFFNYKECIKMFNEIQEEIRLEEEDVFTL